MPSFQEVLNAAISDIAEYGFDSIERIDGWKRKLEQAANESLMSSISMEQKLRDGLAKVYRQAIDKGGIFKHHPGVERFTIERIKPQLRSELDRRIMASASLIKINRQQAIAKTLQRFEGWSTSIPAGGVSAEKRSEVKANTRKALKQLPFEERRVLIDQSSKLISAINDIVASESGAIAGAWVSHWRRAGYQFRPDHKERDGKVYLIRDSWADKAGLVKPGKNGYVDDITAPAQEVYCQCYYRYLYAISALPDDMLTVKGKAKLAEVRQKIQSMKTVRSDSVDLPGPVIGLETQEAAGYASWWPNRITRCGRCSMFEAGVDPRHNRCSAVQGDISLQGHCRLFEFRTAPRADAAPAVGYEAMRRQVERMRAELAKSK